MQRTHSVYGNDIIPIKSDGTKLDRFGKDPNQAGYTLANGATYYYLVGAPAKESPYQAVHLMWDSAAILTITIEESCFADVSPNSTTAGQWVPNNNPNAYISHDATSSWVAATGTVAGGTAGGAVINLALTGGLRTRVKVVVGGTGGVVRAAMNAKD